MKIPLYLYYLGGSLLALLLYVLLDGYDLVGRSATKLYAVNIATLLLTFGGYWGLLRLFRPRLKAFLWSLLLLLQVGLYSTALYAQAPKYGLLLTLLLAPLTYSKSKPS